MNLLMMIAFERFVNISNSFNMGAPSYKRSLLMIGALFSTTCILF